MANPIIAQRILREKQAAALKAAGAPPAPPKAPKAPAGSAPPKPPIVKPTDPRLLLETLPDADLHAKASTLVGYDSDWDRDTLIAKLLG